MTDGAPVHQLNGTPLPDTVCFCCGDDPQNTWDGHYIDASKRKDDTHKIDRRGQICYDCAWTAAEHLERAYPHLIVWDRRELK